MNRTKLKFYVLCAALVAGGVLFAIVQTPAAQPVYCANVEGVCRPLTDWAMMGLKECPKDWYAVPSCTNYGTVEVVPTEPPAPPTPGPTPAPGIRSSLTGPNIAISLPEGYRLEIECAPEQCTLDAVQPYWTLRGPWNVRIIKD